MKRSIVLCLILCTVFESYGKVRIKNEHTVKNSLAQSFSLTAFGIEPNSSFNGLFFSTFFDTVKSRNKNLKISLCEAVDSCENRSYIKAFDMAFYIAQTPKIVELSRGAFIYTYDVNMYKVETNEAVYTCRLIITFQFNKWRNEAIKASERLYEALRQTGAVL